MPFWCCGRSSVNNVLGDEDDAKIKPFQHDEHLDIDHEKYQAQQQFQKKNVSTSGIDFDTTESTKDGSGSNVAPALTQKHSGKLEEFEKVERFTTN